MVTLLRLSLVACVASPLSGRYVNFVNNKEIGNGKFYCWEVDF